MGGTRKRSGEEAKRRVTGKGRKTGSKGSVGEGRRSEGGDGWEAEGERGGGQAEGDGEGAEDGEQGLGGGGPAEETERGAASELPRPGGAGHGGGGAPAGQGPRPGPRHGQGRLLQGPQVPARDGREISVSAAVSHPCLTKLVSHFTSNSTTCLVMELAARGDLEQCITLKGPFRSQPPDPKDMGHQIFRQILEALAYLHGLGVVHRDLKCENVFLGKGIEAKVGDIGFAREIKPEELSRTYCGSPAYAAPELLSQTPYKGRPADLWSAGVVLYIMLSARMPFDDRNIPDMVARQKAHRVPFSRKVFPSLAKAFLTSLLHPDPEQRPTAPQALVHPWFS